MPESKSTDYSAVLQNIPLDQIAVSRHQSGKAFDGEALLGLVASMREGGLMEPVVVRQRIDGETGRGGDGEEQREEVSPSHPVLQSPLQYEVISGERRLRAAKLLDWPTILARVIDVENDE